MEVATENRKALTRLSQAVKSGVPSFLGLRGTNRLPLATWYRNSMADISRRMADDFHSIWRQASKSDGDEIDVVDMFCGCGGMSAGFKAFNAVAPVFRLLSAFDIDDVAMQSYAINLGLQPQNRDISKLAKDKPSMRELGGEPNLRRRPLVLIGCAPCQGFSSHRNADGETDLRNSLFLEFSRLAAFVEPDVVVVENVPELLTDRYWPLVRSARRLLEQKGYYVQLLVHNMATFGVPQERFRALMLAMKKPFSPPQGFLSRSQFRTVRQAIGYLPPIAAGERDANDPMHYTAGHRESTIETIRAVPKDGGSRPEHVGPLCLQRAKNRNGRAVYEDVYGRLSWDRPAITITAYARNPASGRYVHPEQDRGLSVREAALLQGFPSDYQFTGSLDHRFRQIGNAVPPLFAANLASHILSELLNADKNETPFFRGIERSVGPSFSRLIPALKAGHRDIVDSMSEAVA